MPNFCRMCGNGVDPRRYQLGFNTCLECGERNAKRVRHTVVPMHKSNYTVVTDRDLLQWLNKG